MLLGALVVLIVLLASTRQPKARSQERAGRSTSGGQREENPPIRSDIREITIPRIAYVEDDPDADPTVLAKAARAAAAPSATKIVLDVEAEPDEPTHTGALILVTAKGQTDIGKKRKRNEDSLLVRENEGLFVVADGMGGHNGGSLASKLAVDTIEHAFMSHAFAGKQHENLPKRASELACAVQMANEAIYAQSKKDRVLEGMGTTVSAASFSPNKQRLYIAHVGDSRVYRLRGDVLTQVTADHTLREHGVRGDIGVHLSRAVGIWPRVQIDVVLGKPLPGDVYLLCSDGLSKMVSDEELAAALAKQRPQEAADFLVQAANERGGLDNVTVIIVRVESAKASCAA
jgi:protein phosphatase